MSLSDEDFYARLSAAQKKLQEFDRMAGAKPKGAGGLTGALGGAVGGGIVAGGEALTSALQQGAAQLDAFVRQSFEGVFQLGKMSEELGTTTEFLQSMHAVAEEAGVSVEEMDMGLLRLNRSLGMAAAQGEEAKNAFELLGVSAKDLRGLGTEQTVRLLMDRFKAIEDPAKRAAAAQEIFGRSGLRLAPALREGSAAVDEMMAKLGRHNILIDAEGVAKVEKARAAMAELNTVLQGVGQQLAIELAPLVEKIAKGFLEWLDHAGGIKTVLADGLENATDKAIDLYIALRHLKEAGQDFINVGQAAYKVSSFLSPLERIRHGMRTLGLLAPEGADKDPILKSLLEMRDSAEKLRQTGKKASAKPAAGGGSEEVLKKATKALEEQVGAWGLAGAALEIYKARRDGVAEADLAGLKVLEAQLRTLSQSEDITVLGGTAWDEYRAKLEGAHQALRDINGSGEQYFALQQKLEDQAKKTMLGQVKQEFEATRTPLEKFMSGRARLDAIFANRKNLGDLPDRALVRLFQGLGGGEAKLPSALAKDSAEALSAINRAAAQQKTPEDRLRDAIRESVDQEKMQTKLAGEIRDAIRNLKLPEENIITMSP